MEQNVICGNNIELLKSYPDNHFDAIVTDPPYGLGKEPNAEDMLREWLKSGYMEVKGGGFMGKEWDAFVPQPIFWKEVFRVLKPGGYVLAFYGTRTYDWGVMAMRLAGFEVRDCVQWIYGSGFPKSYNVAKGIEGKIVNGSSSWNDWKKLDGEKEEVNWGYSKGQANQGYRADYSEANKERVGKVNFQSPQAKQWEGWGSSLKPAVEPIVVCRKPLEKGLSIAENVLKWGVGGINIDGCRISHNEKQKFTNREQRKEGWNMDNCGFDSTKNITASASPDGRFPANIILECCCDEVIKGDKGKPFNYKGKEYNNKDTSMFNGDKPEAPSNYNDKGDTHTNPDCPCYIMDRQSGERKGWASQNHNSFNPYGGNSFNKSETDRNGFHKGYDDKGGASRFFYQAKASKSERNRGLEGFANNHPTIKPVKLMQYLVRLVTPPNGLVLDPFCGSGTTGIACRLEGFNFVGMEREEDYAKIAQARIDNWFGASAKDSVSERSSLVESASAEDSASARLEPPKEIFTQLKFNF
jgi:site-specific DNA-methyltransferase (adenine-specific)